MIRAHRVGGRPACATVAALQGLWMLHPPRLHIEVAADGNGFRSQHDASRAVRVRARDDIVVHWVPRVVGDRRGQPLVVALRHLATCLPELDAVCTIDSALHRGLVTVGQLHAGSGKAARRLIARCDHRAESGVESTFRLRASAAGFVFRTQAEVPGGRVDFLFGDRLIVEVDGSEFHAGHDAFVADRERDAWHTGIGFKVVRLTYAQVVHRWDEVESLLRLLHARRAHLHASRFRRFGGHAAS